ncbi:hypothetical protein CEXT_169031 [Caerostris extrusa]|uniref:Uncharacterized protein n=1 Tax=Caerostris extrusa TaxID=172846 RepID=A0AAV4XMF2_CAEEX|nr:hypothetical protein CEXT_169031 [Caerostris extrusa]
MCSKRHQFMGKLTEKSSLSPNPEYPFVKMAQPLTTVHLEKMTSEFQSAFKGSIQFLIGDSSPSRCPNASAAYFKFVDICCNDDIELIDS